MLFVGFECLFVAGGEMRAGRLTLGVMFLSIGVVHTVGKRFLAAIVPDYLPAHRELVLISGWSASVAGAALLAPATRRPAAWFMAAWLVAVYPANLWMVQRAERYALVPEWMLWARLPFQIPMIWWALREARTE
jgi:uncharacterized membrane protein